MTAKYKVVMKSWGGTKRDLVTGISYAEALRFCEDADWQYDTGYVWNLEIEEEC